MRNQWGLRLRRIFLSLFTFAATYTSLGASNITVGCPEHERLALIKFKYSVKGESKMLSSWVGVDCCSWEGVRCDRATGNIVSLHLRGNLRTSYSCNIPNGRSFFASAVEEHDLDGADYHLVLEGKNSSLAELRHLKHLDLNGNDFQGSHIPKFIGSLTQLSYLNLSNQWRSLDFLSCVAQFWLAPLLRDKIYSSLVISRVKDKISQSSANWIRVQT